MFDFSIDENEDTTRMHEELGRMKEEFILRTRKLYLYQLELEKKLHQLHEKKLILSDHIEKLEYLDSQLPSNIFLQPPSRDFSFSNYGTEETTFSFGDLEENAEINKIPYMPTDYNTHKVLEIPYIFVPNHTGYELTRDFPIVPGEIIAEKYRIDRIVANTQTSCVLACMNLATKHKVCVKVVQNEKRAFQRGLNEIRVLVSLKNSCPDLNSYHTVKVLDYFYYKEHLFITQELLQETLTSYQENLYKNMFEIKKLAAEVLKCLDLLFVNSVIHCDLNPDNISVYKRSKDDEVHYKVIDFNSAINFKDKELHTYPMLAYTAPEITESVFTNKLDMWSLGCILVECYTGKPLFAPLSEQELLYLIQEVVGPIPGKVIENTLGWKKPRSLDQVVDDRDFRNFLLNIMATDPWARLSPKEALSHDWLSQSI
jgi:Protein kinase domain